MTGFDLLYSEDTMNASTSSATPRAPLSSLVAHRMRDRHEPELQNTKEKHQGSILQMKSQETKPGSGQPSIIANLLKKHPTLNGKGEPRPAEALTEGSEEKPEADRDERVFGRPRKASPVTSPLPPTGPGQSRRESSLEALPTGVSSTHSSPVLKPHHRRMNSDGNTKVCFL